ncbi:MAG: uncharacterized protein JWO05_3792 [Gemmatimonadetes bacterium]|nr:uncharacterized protein [Gemmatimonadota bacterium]
MQPSPQVSREARLRSSALVGTGTSPAWRKGKPTVVIAEDDPVYLHLLSQIAINAGWFVIQASDAMQAIMFCVRQDPTCVMLDVNMPGGSGMLALKRLRANSRTSNLPVIVVTGSPTASLETEARQQGVRHFLSKPVDPFTLQAAMQVIWEQRKATPSSSAPIAPRG